MLYQRGKTRNRQRYIAIELEAKCDLLQAIDLLCV